MPVDSSKVALRFHKPNSDDYTTERGGVVSLANLEYHELSLDSSAGEVLLLLNRALGLSYKSGVRNAAKCKDNRFE